MKKLLTIAMSLLLITGCTSPQVTQKKYSATTTESGFDAPITLVAYCESEEAFQKYFKKMKQSFLRYHQLFDKYHTYKNVNNIKTINDQAGIAPVKVDQDIIDMLLLAKQYGALSNQHFDVTMGAVLNVWHDARTAGEKANQANQNGTLPDMNVLKEAKTYTGMDYLSIDETQKTVYLNHDLVSLDVGAIAKGYASEKVAIQLKKDGLKHAIINAGGNVRIIGNKPIDEAWLVGLQSPDLESSDSLASIQIQKDTSFVTSGDYQRFYKVDGNMIHHIIDPDTLMPAKHQRAVTIITKDSGVADALSTTLFILTYEEGKQIIENLQKQGMEIEAIWVFDKNLPAPDNVSTHQVQQFDIVMTPGLKNNITFH